jgi:hypothetical protein
MATESMTMFARTVDPTGVARTLRELVPAATITGPDDAWHKATVSFRNWWTKSTLTLTHDRAYYEEPKWFAQMDGMRGFLSRCPDTDRKSIALSLTTSFTFAIGAVLDPGVLSDDDPRLRVLYAIAQHLDGVLFTPTGLRDARGRALFGLGGADEEDPAAVWPRVVGVVSSSDSLGAEMHAISRPRPPAEYRPSSDTPSAARVARRALALTAITTRAILERDATKPWAPEGHRDLLAWVRARPRRGGAPPAAGGAAPTTGRT